jgi:osmoprotectant transport system substrate-binding protein
MRAVRGPLQASVIALAVVVVSGACTAGRAAQPAKPSGGTIAIGSFDFPESHLLASIYAQALKAGGYPVTLLRDVGSREVLEPALAGGLVQFVPEYAGSSLDFISAGRATASSDPVSTNADLVRALRPLGLTALAPAPAQNANGIVVTRETATRYGLRMVSDLSHAAPGLVFGGPQECPERAFCLLGLEQTYGVEFADFVPLDTGGPLTLQALRARQVDVALLFTTDPSLVQGDLVLLEDDRRLQPAENVTPLVSAKVMQRYGRPLADLVDSISAALTTEGLRALNREMTSPGASPTAVAESWLSAQGFVT